MFNVGLIGSTAGLATGQSWWLPLMMAAVVVSLVITALDWSQAFRGAMISLLLLGVLLVVVGLRQQPRPFSAHLQSTQSLNTMPLPDDLPAPAARYYRTILGNEMPVVETAVITAHGALRFKGIMFPQRLRFIYDVQPGYRHYIEATIFGLPLLKVNEHYLAGHARLELPVGVVENKPNVDMAANLGFWGEAIWFPSLYLTDDRVSWQAIDETSARLIVPFGAREDTFIVFFDETTGLIARIEAIRYREAADTEKMLWQLTPLTWQAYQGVLIPSRSSVAWADEGTPWLVIELDDVAYNVEAQEYCRLKN